VAGPRAGGRASPCAPAAKRQHFGRPVYNVELETTAGGILDEINVKSMYLTAVKAAQFLAQGDFLSETFM
jgi:hypothetical protein